MKYADATNAEIDTAMRDAWKAFLLYRKCTLRQRAEFMQAIASELEELGDELLDVAGEETHLPQARLKNEKARTIYQLRSYAEACERGQWLEARIDTATERTPARPDLRKMLLPLGPVIVFGAANFPFAYSTAGGDTACALAAGCPVIVKAHPAHAHTSEMVAAAIGNAAKKLQMPAGIFIHLHGADVRVGEALVKHPLAKAVGFTGSFMGGKQLFDWANQRKEPIPVFAEMSSVNPIFLLPKRLNESPEELARLCAASITLGVGQFCTNPGLIVGIQGDSLEKFAGVLAGEIHNVAPGEMLHTGIFRNYSDKRASTLQQPDVKTLSASSATATGNQGIPTLASVPATVFMANPKLHQEVFGPFSLIIECRNMQEMEEVAAHLEGQLTATLMGTTEDIRQNATLVESIQNICGRYILNGVPTGVEVCLSMHHGGPFPATTDSRFTSVGADGIKRFARPVCFQGWPNELLPDELKDENPLEIYRTVNNELRNDSLSA
jgi:2,5-dioxopentanoate dehydrogenase